MTERRFTPNGDRRQLIDKHSNEGGNWGVYNKDFLNYTMDFRHVAPAPRMLEIMTRIQTKANPVVVDAMAPTDVLVDLKTNILEHPGLRGVAMGLEDNRKPEEKERDEHAGITYLTGDMRKHSTWQKLTSEVGINNVDLFMERADGGLPTLPTRKLFYQGVMNRIWNLLSPDHGTAILQLPPEDELEANGMSFRKWITRVQEAGIVCEYVPHYTSWSDKGATYGMLLIEKTSSTQTLPAPENGELDAPLIPTEYPESFRAILEKFSKEIQASRDELLRRSQ